MDRHGVERFRVDLQRLVGFLGGLRPVGVLEREARRQLVRLDQLGIQLDRLSRWARPRESSKPLGADQRQADVRIGARRIALQRLVEEIGRGRRR